jgi:hypothetical protein
MRFCVMFLWVLVMSASSRAATVELWMDLSTPGQFQLRAQVSDGDNAGLASYSIPLKAAPGITITSLDHRSPRAGAAENPDGSLGGPVGFTVFRSADGPTNLLIRGEQDLITPTPFIIYGYGQTAGNFSGVTNGPVTPLGSNEGNNWTSVPVLVSGTYTGTPHAKLIWIDLSAASAQAFTSPNSLAVTTAIMETLPPWPEPSSVTLAATALVALAAGRRRPGSS